MSLGLYNYLDTDDNANSTESLDANGVEVYTLDAGQNWTSQSIPIGKDMNILTCKIITSSIVGTGTLQYQFSIDGINWSVVKDNSGNDVEFDISNTLGTVNITDEVLNGNFRRFVNFACTSGSIKIQFVRG